MPIGGKLVVIHLGVQRVLCLECGVLRQVHLGFAEARRCYTRLFERYVLALSQRMTILDVINDNYSSRFPIIAQTRLKV